MWSAPPVVGAGVTQSPFPLSACRAPKEVISKASGAHVLTEDRCATCRYLWLHLGTAQGSVLSLAVVIPDLVQGCGVEWVEPEHPPGWGWE